MEEFREIIKVYHSNFRENINKFKNRELSLLESVEDGHWLGNGMYFWDNLSNAKYWKNKVESREIIEVLLIIDNILDLTDKEERKRLKRIFNLLKEQGISEIENIDFDNNYQLGLVINILFKKIEELKNNIFVVKCHGLYSHWTEDRFLTGNSPKISNRPTSIVKTIYCVKSNQAIYRINEIIN